MAPQPYEQKSVTGVHHLQCASLRPAAAGQFFEWGGAPVQPYDLEVRRQYISAFMAWMGLPDPSPELIETCRNEFCEALSIRGHKEIGATIFEYRADSIVWQERIQNLPVEQKPNWPWQVKAHLVTDTEARSLPYRDWRRARGMDNPALPNFALPPPRPSTGAPAPAPPKLETPGSPPAGGEGNEAIIKEEDGRDLSGRPLKRRRQSL